MTRAIRKVFSYIFLLVLVGCTSSPKVDYTGEVKLGSISGKVTSKEDSRPLEGILVAVTAPKHFGRHPTNSNGKYRLKNVRTGKWILEFHCQSSANWVGRKIKYQTVEVMEGKDTNVNLVVSNNYCFEPSYSEVERIFTGYIQWGFEYSTFIPCDLKELTLSTNTYSGKSHIALNIPYEIKTRFKKDQLYYIRAKGKLSGPKSYGHLGLAQYGFEFNETIYEKAVKKDDCKRDDQIHQ